MKRLLVILLLLLPAAAFGYRDYRGVNLDSLERIVAKWPWSRVEKASREEVNEYAVCVDQLSRGYSTIDPARSQYYARIFLNLGYRFNSGNGVYQGAVRLGDHFRAQKQYDSAAVYYGKAIKAIDMKIAAGDDEARIDDDRSRLYGSLGNLYAEQDSLAKAFEYYVLADEIFQKYGWLESSAILHQNSGFIWMDVGEPEKALPEFERALQLGTQAQDSLIVAGARLGLGTYYQAIGKTARALEEVTAAYEYYNEHSMEESLALKDSLAIMNAAHEELYRNARTMAIGACLLLILAAIAGIVLARLSKTKKELTETAAVLDETIEELRPEEVTATAETVHMAKREKEVARLIMDGKTTKEIAYEMGVGEQTVFWYRKRLYAKLNVHSAVQFTSEMQRLGLDR